MFGGSSLSIFSYYLFSAKIICILSLILRLSLAREPKFMQIKNGDVKIMTTAKEKGESLYLSVPCDKGWTIKLNGKDVQTQMIGDCLYSIPLRKGKNNLSMHYRVPGFFKGLVVTLIGIILLEIWITVCQCFKEREIF